MGIANMQKMKEADSIAGTNVLLKICRLIVGALTLRKVFSLRFFFLKLTFWWEEWSFPKMKGEFSEFKEFDKSLKQNPLSYLCLASSVVSSTDGCRFE